jgi:hypothetical protein
MRGKPCYRCGLPLDDPMELDHHDDDPSKSSWSHTSCNRAAGNRGRSQPPAPGARTGQPAAELDPVWGDGVVGPDGTVWRQHARDW